MGWEGSGRSDTGGLKRNFYIRNGKPVYLLFVVRNIPVIACHGTKIIASFFSPFFVIF
jgi:hypothetical protein